jgi:hypothetical protein
MKRSLEELRLFIDLRMYDELIAFAEAEIQDNGWNAFQHQINEVRDNGGSIDPLRPTEVNSGKIYDAMLRVLGLETIEGIDVNLNTLVKSSKLSSLAEVRAEALKKALKVLPEQIEKRNTYFLDIGRMETNEFAIYIDDILDARTTEFQALGKKKELTLTNLLNTYYGFRIFASGNNARAISQALTDLAKSFNMELSLPNMNALLVSPKGRRFTHCSRARKRLLDNLVSASLYESLHNPKHGDNVPSNVWTAIHGAAKLGGLCVVPYLLEICERSSSIAFRHGVLEALSHTGDDRAVDLLFQLFQMPKERDYKEIEYLGRIRSPKSIAALKRFADSFLRQGRSAAIRSLGAAYAIDETDTIIGSMSSSFHDDARLAGVEALMLLREKGLDIISERTSDVIGAFAQNAASLGVLQHLMNTPALQGRKGLFEIVLTFLDYNCIGSENRDRTIARMTPAERQSMQQRKTGHESVQIDVEVIIEAIRNAGFKKFHPKAVEFLLSSERIDFNILSEIFPDLKGLCRDHLLSISEFGKEELLQLLRGISGFQGMDKDRKLIALAKKLRHRIMPTILATSDVVVHLERLATIKALKKESLAAEKMVELIPQRDAQPRFDLPQLLLFLAKEGQFSTETQAPRLFMEAVAENLDNTRVYEAILATPLCSDKGLQQALLENLETTFLAIASTKIRYVKWTLPDWMKKEIDEYAKEASDSDPLLAALRNQGWWP